MRSSKSDDISLNMSPADDAESRDLLLASSETFSQMADVARLSDSDEENKVFYSHLSFNCIRMQDCLKTDAHIDGQLIHLTLGHLNLLVPDESLNEVLPYIATRDSRLRTINFRWEIWRNLGGGEKAHFISRWLRLKGSKQEQDAFDRTLEGLVDQISKSQPRWKDIGAKSLISKVEEPPFTVWKTAQSIFDALLNCTKCNCSCPHSFGAKLELGTYQKPLKPTRARLPKRRRKDETAGSLGFDMFLSRERIWHEVRVHAMRETRLGFNLPDGVPLPHTDNDTASIHERIKTLCAQVMTTNPNPLQRLDLKLAGNQLFEMGFEKTDFCIDKTAEAVSLAHCIEEWPSCFTEKTKRVLSLIIGYTVLHLDNTSWLQPGWGSGNIKLFQTASHEVPLRPFIETQLNEEKGSHNNELDEEDLFYHPCPALLSLAVVLLEVYFVKPFKKLAEIYKVPLIEDPRGRIASIDAYQVCYGDEEEGKEGCMSQIPQDSEHLLDAINNCMDSSLWEDDEGKPLDPQLLRSQIYQKVVRQLELHLSRGFSQIPLDGIDQYARAIDFAQWGKVISSREQDSHAGLLLSDLLTPVGTTPPPSITIAQTPAYQHGVHLNGSAYWMQPHEWPLAATSAPVLMRKANFDVKPGSFFDSEYGDHNETAKYERWKAEYKDVYRKFIEEHLSYSPSNTAVRIAILDTGIERDHPLIEAHNDLKGRRNFYDESRKAVPDENGHGTFTASLILDYAPDAELYVIKIAGKENMRPDAQVVVNAINHAVDVWDVDIISMSFGWPSSDFPGQEKLQAAIDKAYSKQILMFAAASNGGANLPRAYPASSSQVICVHSTDPWGNRSRFSPTAQKNNINIATVGQSVQAAWPTHLCEDSPGQDYLVSRSGTSYATPILAGIAAFLLQYARLHVPDIAAALKRKENMEALLMRCAERGPNYDPRDGFFYVQLSLFRHNMFGEELEQINREFRNALIR
ncbi:pfs domain-containing protein [Colletotrichum truncatum]|uniref:Pfs domain-containing protein n=1 Tax=Colletotrichum truncatum TaxID=5467 RepID=A0ACC3YUB7_COLTU|nr:pfs domain-containing protein [Colletotrichum truncatum]KAF6798664.1 pfs domain-containing protein [Colletotrichum truncatum]